MKDELPAEAAATGLGDLYKALAQAQIELANPVKDQSADAGRYQYKYADLATVTSGVRPVLGAHGLSVFQPTAVVDGNMFVETVIAHESGQSISSTYPVCSITGDHQKMGGALTYARRYALCSMLGIAAEDDADGKDAAKIDEDTAPTQSRPSVKRKSSAQSKRDGDWEPFTASIDAATTDDEVRDAWKTVFPTIETWPRAWQEQAKEYAEKRRTEIKRLEVVKQQALQQLGEAGLSGTVVEPEYDNVIAAG